MRDKRPFVQFVGIGFEIVVLILVAVWIGDWLDHKFHGQGLWMGLSVIVAMILWFLHLMYMLKDQDDPS